MKVKCDIHAPWTLKVEGEEREVIDAGGVSLLGEDNEETWIPLCEDHLRLIAAAPSLFLALTEILNHYTALINSGDAGNWDPELEPQVIAARAAIQLATGEPYAT